MAVSTSIYQELLFLGSSVLVGMGLFFLYDILRIFRRILPHGNIWIGVELLLVFCLLWYIVDYFFVLEYNKSLHSCRDMDHTWQVEVALFPPEHSEYQPGESDSTALEDNCYRLLDRIRGYKGVEALAVLSNWSTPGGGGYYGDWFRSRKDTTRSGHGQAILFDPRTDFFKVFRYTTKEGKPVSVDDFDWADPKSVIIGNMAKETFFPDGDAIGQNLESPEKPDEWNFVVKGVVGDIKRFANANKLAQFAGIAPLHLSSSGKGKDVATKQGNRRL